MSRRRSPSRSPLDDNDLLGEILLRLPPLPSSLARAASVCKRWRRLVSAPPSAAACAPTTAITFPSTASSTTATAAPASGPSWSGRIASRHGASPPRRRCSLDGKSSAAPTGSSSTRIGRNSWLLDPIAGEQHAVPFPSSVEDTSGFVLGMVVPSRRSYSYRLVALFAARANRTRVAAYVYSSESCSWGDSPVATLILPSKAKHRARHGTIVGSVIHWFLDGHKVLTFDLERQILAFIELPPEVVKDTDSYYEFRCQIIPALGDGVGEVRLAVLADPNMQFWEKKKTGGDGSGATYTWVRSTTVRLNFPSIKSVRSDLEYQVLGFDDESNAIFIWVQNVLFMVYLKSMQTRKVLDHWPPVDIFPYSSF